MSKGEPLRRSYERKNEPARVGTKMVYFHGDKVVAERWWSTGDEDQMKNAMLLLLETEVGFAIKVIGPAFKDKGTLARDATLEIRRTGYGFGDLGPKDVWTVLYEGNVVAEFGDPEKAVDCFFQTREEYELGHDMADRNFSGHGSPRRALEDNVVVIEPPPPDPGYERGQWVYKDGAVGVVVAVDGDEGVPKANYSGKWIGVWFGSQDRRELCPASAVKPVKPPTYHNGYFMGLEELFGKSNGNDGGKSG